MNTIKGYYSELGYRIELHNDIIKGDTIFSAGNHCALASLIVEPSHEAALPLKTIRVMCEESAQDFAREQRATAVEIHLETPKAPERVTLPPNSWPSDMDHTICDETELTETVVVGQRAYAVPREVAQSLNALRESYATSRDTYNRLVREKIELRELLKALGGCFNRTGVEGAGHLEWSHGTTPLPNLIGGKQAAEFKEFVAR